MSCWTRIQIFSEQPPLVILYGKPAICMAKNGKYTKHTIHISRIMNFVMIVEDFNLHNSVWCEGGLQLAHIGTKNVREDELNLILGCYMVRLNNLNNTFLRGVTG